MKSGGGPPLSQTLCDVKAHPNFRQVLECGGPPVRRRFHRALPTAARKPFRRTSREHPLSMHRELLSHPYIGSYSACLLLALLAGYLLLRWRCVRLGIAGAKIDTLVLLIAGFSLLGARIFSWWFYFPPGAP